MTPDPIPDRHLVLVGLMATGKTTVGGHLAAALGRPLLDSDAQVEARTGRTVRDIWRDEGEGAFRRLEAEALAAAVAARPASVIAGAGGVVLAEANRALLCGDACTVVWLRARPGTLLARIEAADDTHRPLLDEDPAATLVAMHDARAEHYRAVADHVVDVDDAGPEEVAAAVLDAIGAGRPTGARPGGGS